ncbi:hypothetical protein L873DRAFT_1763223 [Choiromyces venosus 120613-1]|uniref:Lytic polysaccharide monooxygenase n=1 Tax=Choiromyces venosus 120613-1 TaxID=1336337 RepID=A0A3N4JXI1_9PEZI|nr:hypothetical protein L873DRAFT_1763223 [Choiromyces venosus 120613-1]
MKTSFSALAAVAALLLSSANAHIQLKSPVPFRTSTQAPQNAIEKDFDMKAPLDKSGSNFPCKGYHKDKQGTQSLVEWASGSTQTMSFDGSATHGGGSCQASLSEDGGATWKVMKSFIGGCPTKDASFVVPQEAKAGAAIFAWTWFNQQGNREMYMNCAAVTITGGGSGLSSFPDMFTANIGKDCATVPGDLAFPNPGKNVEGSGGNPPVGKGCGTTGTQPPAGSSSVATSQPTSVTPTTAPGGPGGNNPNHKPTTTSVPQVTPPAPTTSAPAITSHSATNSTSAPAMTQSPSPTTKAPATTGTGAPAPSTPAPSPSTYPQPSTGGTCVEGTVTCNADGTWSQCGSGMNQNMGKTAGGTVCTKGKIETKTKRSIRFSSEHMARNA